MDFFFNNNMLEEIVSLNNFDKVSTLAALEHGKIIYLPTHAFSLQAKEKPVVFSDELLGSTNKNLSYDMKKQCLKGFHKNSPPELIHSLTHCMHRFAAFSHDLIGALFPRYESQLQWGRTSFRPAEVKGRHSSKRKDDTRLHIDSFPATPVNGLRILRVFSNINPTDKPRVWHLGEPFSEVITRFSRNIPAYSPSYAKLLYRLKLTKTLRSAYDHYQLHLHDQMKLTDTYQRTVKKQVVAFPAGSTWIGFTDQASHAALSGQYLLEQTFYLPVNAMEKPHLSPLSYWAKEKGDALYASISSDQESIS